MTGKWPKGKIDHENHIRDDNVFINLFDVCNSENAKNRSLNKNNKSGVAGITWDRHKLKWRSSIKVNGKLFNLYTGKDKFEAICRRMSANNKNGFRSNHGR